MDMSISVRRFALSLGLMLFAVLALGVASASATSPHRWYVAGVKVPQGTSVAVTGEGNSISKFKWLAGGTPMEVQCTEMSTGGIVQNPTGTASGTFGGHITIGGCTVSQPAGKGCFVSNQPQTRQFSAVASEKGGLEAIEYSVEGSSVLEFILEGCSVQSYNHTWSAIGYLGAVQTAEGPGTYGFTKTSSSLTVSGQEASFTGGFNLSAEGSLPVSLATSTTPATQHWYKGGGGRLGEGPLTKLPAGTPTSFKPVSGASTFNVEGSNFGAQVKIACSGAGNGLEGTAENPVGGGAGTSTETLSVGGCTIISVPKPERQCPVETVVGTSNLAGSATEAEEFPALGLGLTEGTLFAELKTGACPYKVLVNTFLLEGSSLTATAALSAFSLPASLNGPASGFTMRPAVPATASGGFAVETSGGELLRLAP